MDSLFLFQFACFIFMLVNAFFVALSYLHVRWENKRYVGQRHSVFHFQYGADDSSCFICIVERGE